MVPNTLFWEQTQHPVEDTFPSTNAWLVGVMGKEMGIQKS